MDVLCFENIGSCLAESWGGGVMVDIVNLSNLAFNYKK